MMKVFIALVTLANLTMGYFLYLYFTGEKGDIRLYWTALSSLVLTLTGMILLWWRARKKFASDLRWNKVKKNYQLIFIIYGSIIGLILFSLYLETR